MDTMAEHWTKQLKRENKVLRAALDAAMDALIAIPEGRLEKERKFPHLDANDGMVYRTCASESLMRAREAVTAINTRMLEQGVKDPLMNSQYGP